MINSPKRSSYIPLISVDWNFGSPPFSYVTTGSNNATKVIFVPTTASVQAYNHHPFLFRSNDTNTIHLLHSTHDKDEDGAGQYIRHVSSSNEAESWSLHNTVLPAWQAVNFNHTADAIVPSPAGVVISNNVLYVLYDIVFIAWTLNAPVPAYQAYGMLIQPVVNDTFGNPMWLYGGNTDISYSQAPASLKSQIFNDLMKPGNIIAVNVNTELFWPGGPAPVESGLCESVAFKCGDSYWIRYARAYNNLDSSSAFVQIQNSVNGTYWSYQRSSAIPNAPSKISKLNHSSGTSCMIMNPYSYLFNRDPLIFVTGRDGVNWNSIKMVRLIGNDVPVYPGIYKGGAAAYPTLLELNDGSASILSTYSIYKETIAVTKFNL